VNSFDALCLQWLLILMAGSGLVRTRKTLYINYSNKVDAGELAKH